MKKLSTLLLLLCLLPVPTSLAATDEVDISTFFDFEVGTWWEYEDTETTAYGETSTTITYTQVECEDDHDDCYSDIDDEGMRDTVYIEDDVAYYSEIGGELPSEDYPRMDLDGYTFELNEEDYALFGLEGIEPGLTVTCEYYVDDSYIYNSELSLAVTEYCTISGDLTAGGYMEVLSTDIEVEGIGSIESYVDFYVDGELYTQYSSVLVDSSLFQTISPFSDLTSEDDNYTAIEYLYEAGILSGYPDGTFQPENTVNRAELLKILVEGLGVTPDADTYKNCFPDVTDDWYAKYVCYAKESGWVSGYPDGSFKPADAVNKVEALKMLLNSQDVELSETYNVWYSDVAEDAWFALYVQTASDMGLLEEEGSYFNPDADRTRAGISEELYRLLIDLELNTFTDLLTELSCYSLTIDEESDFDEIDETLTEILNEYGYETEDDLEIFLDSIDGELFEDYILAQYETKLGETCPADLEEAGITAEEMADSFSYYSDSDY